MTKRILLASAMSVAMLSLAGCGGGGKNNQGTVETGTSYYKDSAVQGIEVLCGGTESTTDKDGKFTFEVGKGCAFSLAGIPLRETPADKLEDDGTVFENNPKVAKLLQSIDKDGDLTNGIQIDDEVLGALLDALETHDSVGKLPESAVLVNVVKDIGEVVTGVSGVVKTDDEVKEHLAESKLEILLAGKTFYRVAVDSHGKDKFTADDKGVVTYNKSLTKELLKEDGEEDETGSIRVDGDKLIIVEDEDGAGKEYFKILNVTGDYIEISFYIVFGDAKTEYEGDMRLYFDEAKAKAFVKAHPELDE